MTDLLDGHEVIWIAADGVEVGIATRLGPRILGLRLAGGPNVFAELGSAGIDLEGGDRYTFYGGHRLWVAPEVPSVTYWPDDDEVTVEQAGAGVTVASNSGPFAKSLALTFDGGQIRVEHRITNHTGASAEVAAWGITQLRPGGVARLPLATLPVDERGLQPDRLIVAWPYTDWNDPLLHVDDDEVRVLGGRSTPTKVGTAIGRDGALTYEVDGHRFSKRIEPGPAGVHTDLGANGQIYANDLFVELETLGPLVRLGIGESTSHAERWELRAC